MAKFCHHCARKIPWGMATVFTNEGYNLCYSCKTMLNAENGCDYEKVKQDYLDAIHKKEEEELKI